MVSRIWVVALGVVALAASCTSGSSAGPGRGVRRQPGRRSGGFRRQGLYFQCVHFAQRAGAQHRCPAQGKRRWLRGARWPVASCFLRPCPHGRGPAQARHGTGRHGECRQRRQDVHHDCRPEVAGPAPSQHRQPDLAVPAPELVKGPGIDTITFRELLTHRAGFRLDSDRVFATDNAAREQIRQGIQQIDKQVADYNNINFTIFRDMLPFMEGVPDPGRPSAAQPRPAFSSAMFSVRSSIRWASRTPRAPQSAVPCSCTRRPTPGPHGGVRPRWGHRGAPAAEGL